MSGKKKRFPCGHLGKGQFCHRCANEEKRRRQQQDEKNQWEKRTSSAPIPLEHLPREVAEKTLLVVDQLRGGKSYREFVGKRIRTLGQRHIISIPIGRRYRLICSDRNGSYEFIEALSHEDYNKRLSGGGWPC